jgi:hypothetical protein
MEGGARDSSQKQKEDASMDADAGARMHDRGSAPAVAEAPSAAEGIAKEGSLAPVIASPGMHEGVADSGKAPLDVLADALDWMFHSQRAFIGQYLVLGPDNRRKGGQGIVQFMRRCASPCKTSELFSNCLGATQKVLQYSKVGKFSRRFNKYLPKIHLAT